MFLAARYAGRPILFQIFLVVIYGQKAICCFRSKYQLLIKQTAHVPGFNSHCTDLSMWALSHQTGQHKVNDRWITVALCK